jgi:hypothetical protein
MANTGRKVYQFLKEVNVATGVPTGTVKANTFGDPDYVAPVVDYTLCPITAWEATGPFCVQEKQCGVGYALSPDGSVCQQIQTQAATPPSGSGGTPGVAAKQNNNQWNNGGARIYAPGYALDGSGTVSTSLLIPHFWVNGNYAWDSAGRNTTDSRMNVCGIWSAGSTPDNEFIGFSRKITLSAAKTYYVGIAGDNVVRITVNGVKLVEAQNIDGGPNFNYWNIYPIQLRAGDNFVELMGMNLGGPAGFGAEIYDMTESELSAAASESDLNIIFTTASIVGENFDLGQTQGWSCPSGWSLDTSGSGDPVCTLIAIATPSLANTGYKGYSTRRRLVNGSPDGFSEANSNGSGVGPYFAPVQDLVTCPT